MRERVAEPRLEAREPGGDLGDRAALFGELEIEPAERDSRRETRPSGLASFSQAIASDDAAARSSLSSMSSK